MLCRYCTAAIAGLFLTCAPVPAQPPGAPSPATPQAALAATIRAYLLRTIPPVLYESSPGWGRQAPAPSGIKWKGQGLGIHPQITKSARNEGNWRHVRVVPDNLPQTLTVELRKLQNPAPGHLVFDALLSLRGNVDYSEQKWHDGIRLLATSVRARFRVTLALTGEILTAIQMHGIFPEIVFQLHVGHAELRLDHIVVEHLAGLGGDAARLAGEVVKKVVHQMHPSLERELLARANAAILKAANNREMRLGFGNGTTPPAKRAAR